MFTKEEQAIINIIANEKDLLEKILNKIGDDYIRNMFSSPKTFNADKIEGWKEAMVKFKNIFKK